VNCLWSVLDELDDLTSSTNNILELLSSILVHPQFTSAESVCSFTDSSVCVLCGSVVYLSLMAFVGVSGQTASTSIVTAFFHVSVG